MALFKNESMNRLLILITLSITGLFAQVDTSTPKELKNQILQAESPSERVILYLELARVYDVKGDLARAINTLEKANQHVKEIPSEELSQRLKTTYESYLNRWWSQQQSDREPPKLRSPRFDREEVNRKKPVDPRVADARRLYLFRIAHKRKEDRLLKMRPPEQRVLQPLSQGQLNGFNVMIGIPDLESAYLLPPDRGVFWDFKFEYGQYNEHQIVGLQELDIDTSITRATMEFSMPWELISPGWSQPMDIRIGFPYIGWAKRPLFTLNRGRQALLDGGGSSSGLGDVYIDLKYGFHKAKQSSWSLLMRMKLPTGDEKELTGTGSPDASITLLYSKVIKNHRINYNIGSVFTGDSKNFESTSNVELANIIFFNADWGYRVFEDIYLMTSFSMHQNGWKGYTNMSMLEDDPASIGVGALLNRDRMRFYIGYKRGLNGATVDQQFLFSVKPNY